MKTTEVAVNLAVAWLTTTVVLAASGSIGGGGGGGVPMVDNSVAFAVDRCRQFLRLAEFMRASALRKDAGIRNTRAMCEHIVKVEGVTKMKGSEESRENTGEEKRNRHGTSSEKEEKSAAVAAARSERRRSGAKAGPATWGTSRGTSNRIDDPGECRVQLFERNEFQGSPRTIRKSVRILGKSRTIRSIRVLGTCRWRFFSGANFSGRSFEVNGWEMMSRASKWGWREGQIASAKILEH